MGYIKLLYYLGLLMFGLAFAFYSFRDDHVVWGIIFVLASVPIVFYLWRIIKKYFLKQSDAH